MAYSEFRLDTALERFGLQLARDRSLFATTPDVAPSPTLRTQLDELSGYALDLRTEKGRSELLIMPILMDLWRQTNHQVAVLSGPEFTVDPAQGLSGFCDYLIVQGPDPLLLRAPVLAVVEAKREDIAGGYGQCIAEMVAARIFNEREGTPRSVLYGTVTTGDQWRFLRLEGSTVWVDQPLYYLDRIEKILGCLMEIVRS
ncbi:hypothetical protein [Armatimonas sp.]|uniref:hypothetical protein n=1 Tax=Armatimonas sp. TaxID=1872638 RepID=UPI003753437C